MQAELKISRIMIKVIRDIFKTYIIEIKGNIFKEETFIWCLGLLSTIYQSKLAFMKFVNRTKAQ